MDPYPVHAEITKSLQEFLASFDELQNSEESATLGGRVMALRGQGGILFTDVFDGTARVQIVFQKDDLGDAFGLFSDTVDIGDFIQATGTAYVTKRGEKSL